MNRRQYRHAATIAYPIRILVVVITTLACHTQLFAHAFHVSVAEIEHNAKTGRLEVALKLHPSDWERALRAQEGDRTLTLEKTPQLDQLTLKYLRKHFVVRPSKASAKAAASIAPGKPTQVTRPLPLKWVGHELETKWAWLYFEVDLQQHAVEGLVFRNSMFVDLVDDQVNTLNIKSGRQRATLNCHRKQLERPLVWPARQKAAVGAPGDDQP